MAWNLLFSWRVDDRGRPTILVVDDDPMVIRVIRRMLRTEDLVVLEASGAAQALALAEAVTQSIDLLLTDVVMPNGNGERLAEQLCKKWKDLRVLFMSGYPSEVLAVSGFTEVDDLVTKPFTPAVLCERIRRVLSCGASR